MSFGQNCPIEIFSASYNARRPNRHIDRRKQYIDRPRSCERPDRVNSGETSVSRVGCCLAAAAIALYRGLRSKSPSFACIFQLNDMQ
jgi:hypothetical protein